MQETLAVHGQPGRSPFPSVVGSAVSDIVASQSRYSLLTILVLHPLLLVTMLCKVLAFSGLLKLDKSCDQERWGP